jgi:hypothetical protein
MRLISAGSLVRAQSGPLQFSNFDFRFSAFRAFGFAFPIRPVCNGRALKTLLKTVCKKKRFSAFLGHKDKTLQSFPVFHSISVLPLTSLSLTRSDFAVIAGARETRSELLSDAFSRGADRSSGPVRRADEDHAEPNQQWQPVFEERFHPKLRGLKSEISTDAPNIQHRTHNVQWQKEVRAS